MKRKVLFVQSSQVWDAITATHLQLIRALDRSRFEVHVACTPRPCPKGGPSVIERMQAIPDTHVQAVDFGPSFHGPSKSELTDIVRSLPRLPFGLLSFLSYLRRVRPDIVHVGPKPRDAYGVLLAKLLHIKSVFHIHFMYGDWMPKSVQWAMRAADFVIGISKFSTDSVVELGGVAPNKVDFIYNTLDISGWDPERVREDAAEIRREFGIAEDAPLIGIVARLIEWKGHAELMEALAHLKAVLPNVRLLVVGDEAPQAQGREGYAEELKQRAVELGVYDNIVFAGFRSDIARLMAAFDVFAFPAWEEGFGMVVLEAMSMKKPVVAWDNGGPREIVVHGETGLLVEPKNVLALADALLEVLTNSELRERLGERGRERAEKVFASDHAGAHLADIYERCLAESRYPIAAE